MPDKDGDDDEKSAKSVVNKKQKQMMNKEDYLPEEGYDIARDMGKVSPSKDKKDATSLPVSDKVKKTQKVNKGPSAFEIVKAKYGKSVMNGKKKANEELDLSKVAESFGGYIVEARKINKKIGTVKSGEEEGTKAAIRTSVDKTVGGAETPAGKKRLSDISAKSKIGPDTVTKFKKALKDTKGADQAAQMSQKRSEFAKSFVKPANVEIDPKKQSGMAKDDVQRQGGRIGDTTTTDDGTTATALSGPVKVTKVDPRTLVNNPKGDPVSPKPEKEPRSATRRKSTATEKPFATRTGESGGPLPVSMRNRRVPKTSSLSTPVTTTIVKTPPSEIEKLKPTKKGNIVIKPFKRRDPGIDGIPTEDEPKTGTGGQGGGGRRRTTTAGFGRRFGQFMQFTRDNPAVSLIGYDMLRKAGSLAKSAVGSLKPVGVKGGKAIQVRAGK